MRVLDRSGPRRRRPIAAVAAAVVVLLATACGSSDSAGTAGTTSTAGGPGSTRSPVTTSAVGSSFAGGPPASTDSTGSESTPATSVTGPAAPGWTATTQPDAGDDSVLRYVAVGAPASAINDPHGGVLNQSDLVRFSLAYDVLAAPGPHGTTQLRLAQSITPDSTGTKWTVTIRPGATFTDGTPVEAADVLFSLRRILEKKAENFGRMAMFDLDSSKVIDPTSLELHTTAPYFEVPRALESVTYVVPRGTKDFSTPPIGSGSYTLVSQSPDVAVLERNDSWWGPRPAYHRIEVRAVIDPQARAQAVISGQADVAQAVNYSVVRQVQGSADVQVVKHTGVQSYPFVMRMDTPPFDDARVRKAFKLAADRSELVTAAFDGLGTPSADILAPYEPGAPQTVPAGPQIAEAKQLLAEAGHPDGVDVELYTTTSYPGMQQAATVFARQLAVIGVRAKVTVNPPDTYWTQVYNTKPFYTGFFGGISFLDMARVSLLSSAPANDSQWHNSGWDKAFDAAMATRDDSARAAELATLQEQFAADGGYLVWGHGDIIDLASSEVTGLPDGPGFAGSFIDQVGQRQ